MQRYNENTRRQDRRGGMPRRSLTVLSALGAAVLALSTGNAQAQAPPAPAPQVLSLAECLKAAMDNNHRRPASRFAVTMAEAQHRQALSGYWPQITAKVGWTRMDQSPNFIFPAGALVIPSQTVAVPGGTTSVTIPANAFGPGFPPSNIQVPVSVPGQNITTPAQIFPIPQQDIKVADPQTVAANGSVTWLLFDGGMRKGYREQALGGLEAAQAEARRTDLEITDSVTRLYYGAVLAQELTQVGEDTLARMQVTLELTESLYKSGAGRVSRIDYLDNQVMVETLRAAVAELAKNQALAEAALAYTMGMPWNASVRPSATEVPYEPFAGNVQDLVTTAYEFNPDWARLEAGLRALQGGVTTARSGYFPKIALTGQLFRWWNDYEGGIATPANKAGWTIGAGAEIPVFNGFLTRNKVAEALARLNKLKEEKILLREGIGLQVREQFLSLEALLKSFDATKAAMDASREDRELTVRAYQSELVDTEKVIRAQLFEALMTAQHLKTRYDYLAAESRVSLLVGKEVAARLNP